MFLTTEYQTTQPTVHALVTLENWIFYSDNKMSIIFKFIDFL